MEKSQKRLRKVRGRGDRAMRGNESWERNGKEYKEDLTRIRSSHSEQENSVDEKGPVQDQGDEAGNLCSWASGKGAEWPWRTPENSRSPEKM